VSGLSQLPLKKLGMTTNGLLVKPLLSFLATTSCRHLNFSLDTLKPDRFETITGSPHHMEVVDTIRSAADRGFRVKINMVLIKGLNDDEVLDYIEFSENYGIEVRFLELMRIGPDPAWSAGHFIPAQTIIDRIKERYTLVSRQSSSDSTSCNFQTDSNALIGFIAAESKPFCSACSRLRLTAQGMLRPCLMDDHEVRIAGRAPRHYPEILKRMLTEKPVIGMRRSRRSMCFIGG
jgi:cyclic pyranopterin phosphate synthase